jgi:hypothetical protein
MGDDDPRPVLGEVAFGELPELLGCRVFLHHMASFPTHGGAV